MFATQLTIDVDEIDDYYEVTVRFAAEDLEWSGKFPHLHDITSNLIGDVIVKALRNEYSRQAREE